MICYSQCLFSVTLLLFYFMLRQMFILLTIKFPTLWHCFCFPSSGCFFLHLLLCLSPLVPGVPHGWVCDFFKWLMNFHGYHFGASISNLSSTANLLLCCADGVFDACYTMAASQKCITNLWIHKTCSCLHNYCFVQVCHYLHHVSSVLLGSGPGCEARDGSAIPRAL